MQSGISASADLITAFKALLTSTTERGLLASIEQETLIPSQTLPRSSPSSSLAEDLSALSGLLTTTAAAYIILRDDTSGEEVNCTAITYVPDTAPVRQKMLFASTRLTLVRELGTEHFSGTLFATTKDELSPAGWQKQVEHGALSAPLTEEERNLEDIKAAEANESMGTGARRGGHVVAGGVSMPVSDDAVLGLRDLAGESGGMVVLNLDLATETISLVSRHSAAEASPGTLATLVSSTKPTYSFYKHTNGSVLFIYCCPAGCSVKERMTYAASARSVPLMAEKEANLSVTQKMEVSGTDEMSEKDIIRDIEPEKAASSSGGQGSSFARPKRPGRR